MSARQGGGSPEEVGARLAAALGERAGNGDERAGGEARAGSGERAGVDGGGAPVASGVDSGGRRAVVDVEPRLWVTALRVARDELGCDFFDWLSAVDEGDGGFRIVAHVWSVAGRSGLLIRTILPAGRTTVDSAVGVYPGAAWHERETYEMFGVEFAGHPGLVSLLLPDGFDGHPLRKDFVLAARVTKAWPGVKEPGGQSRRTPMRPSGVPAPGEWGPPPGDPAG